MTMTRLNVEDGGVGSKTSTHNYIYNQGKRRQGKGIGNRIWLVVTNTGDTGLDEVSKHQIMRRTGLSARDLRALDPVLSYPSSILGRERAIVVNIEHIKAIVTATEVLLLNSSNPLVVNFVEDLRQRIHIADSYQQAKESSIDQYIEGKRKNDSWNRGSRTLPFEFKALEACLESACRCLESETRTLEQEAYPALDELTSRISTLNLERVRQIKSRLVEILGRVQKERDQVEHLLDDDNDMAEMYLTEKVISSPEHISMKIETNNDAINVVNCETDDDSKSNSAFTFTKPNIQELEMLLEAYFAQLDGIFQKLSTLSEYVGDTEDYINIMLDDKQNQLLQMGVVLSTANMIINAGIVVVGIFGMNIDIPLFAGENRQFWEAAIGTVGSCIVLYILAIGWGRKRYLM